MKKTKFLALLVAVLALAGCDDPKESSTPVDSSTPVESTTPDQSSTPEDSSTPEEQVENYAQIIADYIYETYKTTTNRMADFTLPGTGLTYDSNDNPVQGTLVWSLEVTPGGVEGAITLGEVVDGNYPFTVVYNVDASVRDTHFTLKCVVTDPNGKTAEIEIPGVVPAFKYASYQDFKDAVANDSDEVLNVLGTVTAIYKSGVYLVDEEGNGFYAYSPTVEGTMDQATLLAAYPIGSKVIASGTATLYNGQYEFNKGCTVRKVEDAAADFAIPYADATEAFTTGGADALGDLVNTVVEIKGVTIGEIDNANYYYYFTIGENKYYLRTSASYNDFNLTEGDPKNVNDIVKEWTEGYKADIKGLVGIYSGKYYLTPIEMDAVKITETTLSDDKKVEIGLSSAERTYGVTYNESTEVVLPANDENGVSYTYVVKEGTGIAVVDGKLVVTQSAVETTNVLTVTATLGSITQSVDITVVVGSTKMDLFTSAELNQYKEGDKANFYYGGIVTEIKSDKYGNMYIQDANGESFYVYGLYDGAGNRYDAMENAPKVGDYVIVYEDEMAAYKGSLQFSNAVLVANLGAVEDVNTDYVSAAKIAELGAGLTQNNEVVPGTYSYTVAGIVTSVANEKYGNIYIEDAAGNSLYVYGTFDPDGKVPTFKVGDYVTLKIDCISYYKGVQAKNATVVGQYDATEKKVIISAQEKEDVVVPEVTTVTTIADAMTAKENDIADLKEVKVSEIYYEWSDTYNNMSFYVTDGTNQILVFRAGTKVVVGDIVSVNGKVTAYNGTNQIAEGSTVTITGHEEVTPNPEPDPILPGDATVASSSIADVATANSWENSKLYDSFALDANVTVTATGTPVGNYGLNTGKYYTSGNNWRIYQNENPQVTVSVAEGYELVSVKITYASQNSGVLTLDGANIESGQVVEASGSSIVFSVGNTSTKTNGQARINNIEVTYAAPSAAPSFEPFTLDFAALLAEMGGSVEDKAAISEEAGQLSSLGLLDVTGTVQARTSSDAIKYLELAKKEGGELTFTAPTDVVVTVVYASTGGSNTSLVGVKVNGAYAACNETDVTTSETPNVYSVTGTGGTTFTYTVTAGSVVSFVTPETARNARIVSLSIVAAE